MSSFWRGGGGCIFKVLVEYEPCLAMSPWMTRVRLDLGYFRIVSARIYIDPVSLTSPGPKLKRNGLSCMAACLLRVDQVLVALMNRPWWKVAFMILSKQHSYDIWPCCFRSRQNGNLYIGGSMFVNPREWAFEWCSGAPEERDAG